MINYLLSHFKFETILVVFKVVKWWIRTSSMYQNWLERIRGSSYKSNLVPLVLRAAPNRH